MNQDAVAQLTSIKAGIGICWLGNLSWLIAAGGMLVATDLDLDPQGRNERSAIPTEAIAPHLDVHLITHEHGDHFSAPTCRVLFKRSACTFVVSASCVDKARDVGIPAARLRIARPGEPLNVAGLHIEPIHALHGHLYGSVYRGANMEDCGYLFTIGGKKVLQPGDTVLLHEHLELTGVDVLFVSPTEHSMGVQRAAVLINVLEPTYIFPQHFGTYVETDANRYWTKGYPDELRVALPRPMQERFHKLALGEVYVIE